MKWLKDNWPMSAIPLFGITFFFFVVVFPTYYSDLKHERQKIRELEWEKQKYLLDKNEELCESASVCEPFYEAQMDLRRQIKGG